jgi:antigen flippase
MLVRNGHGVLSARRRASEHGFESADRSSYFSETGAAFVAENTQACHPFVIAMETSEIKPVTANIKPPPVWDNDRQSYGQILKSSGLIGSASLINVAFRIVRTKAMALLLGPSGIGLLSLYSSVSDMAVIVAGMGLSSSGVRQIAEAAATGDARRVARTVIVLRRAALVLGVIGALLLAVLGRPISRATFGDDQHAGDLALLSLAVFFTVIASAQGALVQGMRRIADLARLSVIGVLSGTILSIAIVYVSGQRGLVPSLVCVAGTGIATSWWYARKIEVKPTVLTWSEAKHEASELLKLGLALMGGTMVALLASYLVRIVIREKIGMEAIGFYQAAWVLGGFYVEFIVQAMAADFYPRLTAVAHNNPECNRLVNEQTEIGLLLAGPGLLATLTFAPLVIFLLYSAEFHPAVKVFRWICLGMMLRVITWPMGFIQLAKGERTLFFCLQFVAGAVHVSLVWLGVRLFGLTGTGAAFFGLWVIHCTIIYSVARRLSDFRWSTANRHVGTLFALLSAAVFGSWYVLPPALSMIFGAVVTLCAGVYSLKTLCSFVPMQRFPRAVQKLVSFLHLVPAK